MVLDEGQFSNLCGYLKNPPARHRSRPKEAVSTAQGVRSGEAGGGIFTNSREPQKRAHSSQLAAGLASESKNA